MLESYDRQEIPCCSSFCELPWNWG